MLNIGHLTRVSALACSRSFERRQPLVLHSAPICSSQGPVSWYVWQCMSLSNSTSIIISIANVFIYLMTKICGIFFLKPTQSKLCPILYYMPGLIVYGSDVNLPERYHGNVFVPLPLNTWQSLVAKVLVKISATPVTESNLLVGCASKSRDEREMSRVQLGHNVVNRSSLGPSHVLIKVKRKAF